MFWACNFGRDADTIAALVGAMSGAIHGSAVIPEMWVSKVRRPAGVCLKFTSQCDIPEVAKQLVEVAYERAR
jgi:ADP-ribosylglycohydrolase